MISLYSEACLFQVDFGCGDGYWDDGLEMEVFILKEKAQLGQQWCKLSYRFAKVSQILPLREHLKRAGPPWLEVCARRDNCSVGIWKA